MNYKLEDRIPWQFTDFDNIKDFPRLLKNSLTFPWPWKIFIFPSLFPDRGNPGVNIKPCHTICCSLLITLQWNHSVSLEFWTFSHRSSMVNKRIDHRKLFGLANPTHHRGAANICTQIYIRCIPLGVNTTSLSATTQAPSVNMKLWTGLPDLSF